MVKRQLAFTGPQFFDMLFLLEMACFSGNVPYCSYLTTVERMIF